MKRNGASSWNLWVLGGLLCVSAFAAEGTRETHSLIQDIYVDRDDRLYVLKQVITPGGGTFIVSRYLASGKLDQDNFGVQGHANLAVRHRSEALPIDLRLAVDEDNKHFTVGFVLRLEAEKPPPPDLADPNFFRWVAQATRRENSMSDSKLYLVRLDFSGVEDKRFGKDGIRRFQLGNTMRDRLSVLETLSGGDLAIAVNNERADFATVRILDSKGQPSARFRGHSGFRVKPSLPEDADFLARSLYRPYPSVHSIRSRGTRVFYAAIDFSDSGAVVVGQGAKKLPSQRDPLEENVRFKTVLLDADNPGEVFAVPASEEGVLIEKRDLKGIEIPGFQTIALPAGKKWLDLESGVRRVRVTAKGNLSVLVLEPENESPRLYEYDGKTGQLLRSPQIQSQLTVVDSTALCYEFLLHSDLP